MSVLTMLGLILMMLAFIYSQLKKNGQKPPSDYGSIRRAEWDSKGQFPFEPFDPNKK